MARKINKADVQAAINAEAKRFSKFVDNFIRESGEGANRAVRRVGLQVFRDIALLTPVDTGRARAGWFPAIEGLGGKTPGGGESSAVAEGRSAGSLEEEPLKVTAVNAVKYVPFLEFGHSAQAPSGMVRVALMKNRDALPKAIIDEYKALWNGEAKFRARRVD